MRRILFAIGTTVMLAAPSIAAASTYVAGSPVTVNAAISPLSACAPFGPGTNYANTEVEPFLAVNPANSANVVATWRWDRYSGGRRRAPALV